MRTFTLLLHVTSVAEEPKHWPLTLEHGYGGYSCRGCKHGTSGDTYTHLYHQSTKPQTSRCFGVASLLPPQTPSGTAEGTSLELGHGLKFLPSALR